MRDALDAAWGDFPAGDVGLDWMRYTGNARPSREWVTAVLAHSRVTFIQESYSSRSSEGYDVGVADCRYAEARAREVHPNPTSIAVVVSDGNGADRWDASDYGRGWASVATLPFFAYGAVPICESFNAGAGRSLGTWVPETWGAGTLMSQVVGPSPIANTDLNHVHADYTGGTGDDMTPDESQHLNEVWGELRGAPAYGIAPLRDVITKGNADIVAAIKAIPTAGGSAPPVDAELAQLVHAAADALTALAAKLG